jgi:hypothetical protein
VGRIREFSAENGCDSGNEQENSGDLHTPSHTRRRPGGGSSLMTRHTPAAAPHSA